MNIYEYILNFHFLLQSLPSRHPSVSFLIRLESSPSTDSLTFTNLHSHSFLREFSPSRFAPSEISWQSKWRRTVGIHNCCLFHLYCLFLFSESVWTLSWILFFFFFGGGGFYGPNGKLMGSFFWPSLYFSLNFPKGTFKTNYWTTLSIYDQIGSSESLHT